MAVAVVVVPATASAATGYRRTPSRRCSRPATERPFPPASGSTPIRRSRSRRPRRRWSRSTAPITRSTSGPTCGSAATTRSTSITTDKVIADQIVGRDGGIGPTYTGALILGIYARGHYGGIFDSPLVLVPFTLMFLLPLLLLRRAVVVRPVRHRCGADVRRLLRCCSTRSTSRPGCGCSIRRSSTCSSGC